MSLRPGQAAAARGTIMQVVKVSARRMCLNLATRNGIPDTPF
jgi:hypothetical protein